MEPDGIYYSDTKGRNLFGYRIEDGSMEPVFRRGDILVVNPNIPAQPGDYVIARVGEETVPGKMDASGLNIEPLAAGRPRLSAASSEILGRVVEKKRMYK